MIRTRTFEMRGGLDLSRSGDGAQPGSLIAAVNYEPHARGYARIAGYERFDRFTVTSNGLYRMQIPSEATYRIVEFANGSGGPFTVLETLLEGAANRGVFLGAEVISGSWGAGDAAGTFGWWPRGTTGSVSPGDTLTGATSSATMDVVSVGAEVNAQNFLTTEPDLTYYRNAHDASRADVSVLPYSDDDGSPRTVFFLGEVYAVYRDGTDLFCARANNTSFTAIGHARLEFTSGSTEIQPGDTVDGATSGASGVVVRVVLLSGTWSGGDAAGFMHMKSLSGTFQAAENLDVGASLNVATCSGPVAGITSLGTTSAAQDDEVARYVLHNFFGGASTRRAYVVTGHGKAHEINTRQYFGTSTPVGDEWSVPITTGASPDEPTHVAVHANHLFLAFRGGSIQFSAPGDPHNWTVSGGAGEIGFGDEVTGMISTTGVLAIFGTNQIGILRGSSSNDFALEILSRDGGAAENSIQQFGNTVIFADGQGVRTLAQTDAFGDFAIGSLTNKVDPIWQGKMQAGVRDGDPVRVINSVLVSEKGQYRVYWNDGTALILDFRRRSADGDPEIMALDYQSVWRIAEAIKLQDGKEYVISARNDGVNMVLYRHDSGPSFDGSNIPAFLGFAFDHIGAPQNLKRWTKATVTLETDGPVSLGLRMDFDYAATAQIAQAQQNYMIEAGGGFGQTDNFFEYSDWAGFSYSAPVDGVIESHVDGIGFNAGLTLASDNDYENSHVIHSVTLNYSARKLRR